MHAQSCIGTFIEPDNGHDVSIYVCTAYAAIILAYNCAVHVIVRVHVKRGHEYALCTC